MSTTPTPNPDRPAAHEALAAMSDAHVRLGDLIGQVLTEVSDLPDTEASDFAAVETLANQARDRLNETVTQLAVARAGLAGS